MRRVPFLQLPLVAQLLALDQMRACHRKWRTASDAQKFVLACIHSTSLAFQSILGTYVAGSAGTLNVVNSVRATGVPSHWTA
jgi:hypothetical protein